MRRIALKDMAREGGPIRGYFLWTLMDNIERAFGMDLSRAF